MVLVGRRINVITGNGREMVETVDTKNVTFCRKCGLVKQIRRLEARGLQPGVVKVSVSVLPSLWSLFCVSNCFITRELPGLTRYFGDPNEGGFLRAAVSVEENPQILNRYTLFSSKHVPDKYNFKIYIQNINF